MQYISPYGIWNDAYLHISYDENIFLVLWQSIF